MGAKPVELRLQAVEMSQIAHADRAAADLVLIGRPDTATGRADLALARRRFAQHIQIAVNRQDQRAIVGNGEIIGIDDHALPFELGDFRLQRPRIKHHAIADDRQGAAHDA